MVKLPLETLLAVDKVGEVDALFLSVCPELAAYRKGDVSLLESLSLRLEDFLIEQFGIEEAYQDEVSVLKVWDDLIQFYNTITKPVVLKLKVAEASKKETRDVWQFVDGLSEVSAVPKMLQLFDQDTLAAWVQDVWVNKTQPYIDWQIFAIPQRVDFSALVKVRSIKPRVDYSFVGPTISGPRALHQANYCIECHDKNNDSCSIGFVHRKTGAYKVSPLGRVLSGCPLSQKISEMHRLRKRHQIIAALAMVMVDNPLCLVTGDRICNDCMVSCIYQKVEPVDTPSVESDTLRRVLKLPYGAEIYLLLARWNPLKTEDYMYHRDPLGRVAVVGMGPAGFAMSYYLLMQGCQVVGFDGLAIRDYGDNVNQPIVDFDVWASTFNRGRALAFGGVIDYGITVRWDKRLILLVWVLLKRFPRFSVHGNLRLGGAITVEKLSEMGFDQVVLATGAGLPKAHPLQHTQGVYFANEFLMRLQISGMLQGALQSGLRLPIVVVGGGLTAIDTATEAQVYYIKWVEQVAFWYSVRDEELLSGLTPEDREVVSTWISHGEAIKKCRCNGGDLYQLLLSLGGVHIVYRRKMQESPAYRLNYLELEKALEQGIQYHENLNPIRAESKHGHVERMICQKEAEEVVLMAKSIFIATGSKPNVAYYYESREPLALDEGYYRRTDKFTAWAKGYADYVSIIGDLHPDYQGSVVGALASAKDSYKGIVKRLSSKPALDIPTILKSVGIRLIEVFSVSEQMLGLRLETDLSLPIGSYIKVTVVDSDGVLQQVKAVVVTDTEAWVEKDEEGARYLNGKIFGVLGPSGTRLVGKGCSDTVVVIADDWGIRWAAAVGSAVRKMGKRAVLYGNHDILVPYFDKVHDLDLLPDNFSGSDVYYCLEGKQLAEYQNTPRSCREAFAIVDGPMMCMLKGICGQCIQWQIEEGKPLKAVYSCSWQSQPLTLIDLDHLQKRQNIDIIEKKLYKQWQKIKDKTWHS